MPASVEITAPDGVSGCSSLSEIAFATPSHHRAIVGFGGCRSHCLLVIPASVEIIAPDAFY
jgi:hypothetical protein